LISGAPVSFDFSGISKPELRLSVKVERDVGKREILLQDWPAAAPFSETLAQNETAVPEAEDVIEKKKLRVMHGLMKCVVRNDFGFHIPQSAIRISSQMFYLLRHLIKRRVPIDLALSGFE
jgi:hypothetical protein